MIFRGALRRSGGIFDYDGQVERLEEVSREMELPSIWDDPEHAQELGREHAALESSVTAQRQLIEGVRDAAELLEMAEEENNDDTLDSVADDLQRLEKIGRASCRERIIRSLGLVNLTE